MDGGNRQKGREIERRRGLEIGGGGSSLIVAE